MRAQLRSLLASGITSELAIEMSLGLPGRTVERYLAGESALTAAEEAKLLELLGEYRRHIRQANAEVMRDRVVGA